MKTFIALFIFLGVFTASTVSGHPPRERRLHRIEHRLERKLDRYERRHPHGVGRRDERLERKLNAVQRMEYRTHRRHG